MRTYVTAVFRANEGHEDEVERIFRSFVTPTHEKDRGCVSYALNRGQDDPRTFVFMEEWGSREDLEAHLETDHIQEGLAALAGKLESQNIILLERLEGGDVNG